MHQQSRHSQLSDFAEEQKEQSTPQPRKWNGIEIADLTQNDHSAKLVLMLNEEPRLSIISEGLNSLVTVDEFLMTTRQYS